jgi:hypothetical protein
LTHARWKGEGYDPELLASRLEGARRVATGGGAVTFADDPLFEDAALAVESGVDFVADIPESDRRDIVSTAMFTAPSPLTPGSLIGEINRRARDFLREPERPYVLATSISARYFAGLNRSEVSGRRMYFRGVLPRHLRAGHGEAADRTGRYLLGPLPSPLHLGERYTAVWVHTRGRSHWEAVSRALDALDLLRSIWNFALNRRKWSRTTGGARRPVNQVLLGPLHSLHDPDGSLVSPANWFDSDYVRPVQSRELSRRWEQVREDERDVRASLARSAYRESLEDALRRYTRALDLFQWEVAFLGLWGLLETLTGTKPHDSHDLTMRRASFLYPDPEREVHFQTLTHLRHYRNRSVHGGESSATIEAYLYQLKRYVEQLLLFHLTNSYGFGSVEQAGEFLGLPPGPADLRRLAKDRRRESDEARAAELATVGEQFCGGL